MSRLLAVLLAVVLATPAVAKPRRGPPPPPAAPAAKAKADAQHDAKVEAHNRAIARSARQRTVEVIRHTRRKCVANDVVPQGHLRKSVHWSLASAHAFANERYRRSVYLALGSRMHARKALELCGGKAMPEWATSPEEEAAAGDLSEADVETDLGTVRDSVPSDADILANEGAGVRDVE